MRIWLSMMVLLPGLLLPTFSHSAEITDVIDAADDDDPFDLNIDVSFHSTLDRAKISREFSKSWTLSGETNRFDYNALHYENQIYATDYMIEIGLYHDLEVYVNVPWVIKERRKITLAAQRGEEDRLYYGLFAPEELTANPSPSTTRSGIGDMTVGIKWAPFNGERDDTTSTWVIGMEYVIPTGELSHPNDLIGGKTGGVGLGHHQLIPFMLFSRRFRVLDPYCGVHATIPIQGSEAKDKGLELPYHGGFLVGMEIVPWENTGKNLKFAIDLRLTTEFFAGIRNKRSGTIGGTSSELSDFLWAHSSDPENPVNAGSRQFQTATEYAQFGVHLGFVFRLGSYVRLRFGASLSHNTEHFLTGAEGASQATNDQHPDYYDAGMRFRVEETTIFTYWATGMILF